MSTLKCFAGCVGILGLASAAVAQPIGANCIDTLMNGGNRGNNGGTIFFDLDVGPNALTFTDLFVNNNGPAGVDLEVLVYTTVVGGTFAGNELNIGAWTQVGLAEGVSAGQNNPTHVILLIPFVLDANTTQGVALELFHFGAGAGHEYTNGNGANQVYTNVDLRLTGGSATNGLFGPSVFNPRVFNGWLFYDGGTAGCTNPPPPPPKPLPCDAVEIFSMTVPSSQIEMDSLPLGPVDVAALNAAGTPGPADLCRVEAPDNPSTAPGVYNTNSSLGNALARVGGVITIIEGASGTAVFDGTTYDIIFNSPHTEFGFEIGDWNGPMIVDLYDGTTQLATILTSTTALVPQYIQIRAVAGCEGFNRATIASSTGLGNFVLTQIWTQEGTAACGGVCPCACDFDPDPLCDIFDFLAFQNQFVLGDPCACLMDPDPLCDIFDFLAFQNEFVRGCQ